MIATVKLNIRIPVPSSMFIANILGVLGLLAVTVSVGALAGNFWWSALTGGVIAVVLSLVTAANASAETAERPAVAAAPMAVARPA